MRHWSALLAMFAAIMLVVAGAPGVAAANPCNPCPPDCPMMQAAMGQADHHGKAPQQPSRGDNPCKASLACQTALAMPLLPQSAVATFVTPRSAVHPVLTALAVASRPPDQTLRPPIQL